MKSINYLIVELDEAYDNKVSVGDVDVIVNSTIESVANINRVARVVEAPSFVVLEKGDEVVVHHNIFRLRNDVKGNVAESSYHIEGNLYFVPFTEVFMYRRDKDWKPLVPFCFVEPIKKEVKEGFELNSSEDSYKGRVHRLGVMKYPNEELLEQGVKEGDKVLFSKYSEYEFVIDGKLYYKMSTKDILAVE